VEYVPTQWGEEIEAAILTTQRYLDAAAELMAINVELLALSRAQRRGRPGGGGRCGSG
jgi:hypothetical protein